jgi:hypothetical protein
MRAYGWLIPLAGCVLSDEPRRVTKDELLVLLEDDDVRAAVLEALADDVVSPAQLDAALADHPTTADLASALGDYATSEALTAVADGALPADQSDCGPGAYVSGWDSDGYALCATPLASQSCPSGAISGFGADGTPLCATLVTADVDAAWVSADTLDAGAALVGGLTADVVTAEAFAGGSAGLVLRGPARFEPGDPADRIQGDADLSSDGWVQVATSNARRGTLAHALRIEPAMPTTMRVGVDYDDAVGAPDLGATGGQGILLDVTAWAASSTTMEVVRCTFALVKSAGVGVTVARSECDELGGAGMTVELSTPGGGRANTGFDLAITRTITETGGSFAFQIDFLTAFPTYDWRFIVAP